MSAQTHAGFFQGSVEGRKGEILDAAIDVFGAKGYDAGGLREIAEIVGISEPAIYRHFASKKDLFEQLLSVTGERVLAEAGPLLDSASASNIAEALDAIAAQRSSALPAYVPIIQTAMVAVVHNPEFMETYTRTLIQPMLSRIADLVQRIDTEHGITYEEQTLESRVRILASVFTGYFMTSMVMGGTPMSVAHSVMCVMGWGASADHPTAAGGPIE